jgi:hypothetical protein
MEAIPLSITCALNDELIKMAHNPKYSPYYQDMIRDEMRRRGLNNT